MRKEIAINSVARALNESDEIRQFIESTDLPEITRQQFEWQIEAYLERIYYSLHTDSPNLLHEPGIPLSLPVTAYQTVLRFVKQRVPEQDISEVAATQVKYYLDYLITRL